MIARPSATAVLRVTSATAYVAGVTPETHTWKLQAQNVASGTAAASIGQTKLIVCPFEGGIGG